MFKAFNIVFVLALLAVPSCIKAIAVNTHQNENSTGNWTTIENDVKYLSWARSKQHQVYQPNENIIYHDIFDALNRKVVEKYGNPNYWLDNHPEWHKRNILRFGHQRQPDDAGLKVNLPDNPQFAYNTLWVRVLNDRWFHFRVKSLDEKDATETERYTCGRRELNEYSPDGGAPDSYHRLHMWCQVPIRSNSALLLASEVHSDSFISGIAFSTNPWNLARNSALAYHWATNGGTALTWDHDSWNSDVLARMDQGKIHVLRIPVIPSEYDKLVYLVEHNNNWIGIMHAQVWVNEEKVERFRTTYDNPFATHYNSKLYDRYIALRVPNALIKRDQKFLEVRIDMTLQDHNLYIREAGTHDYI